jgi:hypothetical protein
MVSQSDIEQIKRAIERLASTPHGIERDDEMLKVFAGVLHVLGAHQQELDTLRGLPSLGSAFATGRWGRLKRSLNWALSRRPTHS